ncbi:MAG: hypothetical protein RI947_300 [Candidatus Parcubacteria bacterium]|jgi:hypothetical protein
MDVRTIIQTILDSNLENDDKVVIVKKINEIAHTGVKKDKLNAVLISELEHRVKIYEKELQLYQSLENYLHVFQEELQRIRSDASPSDGIIDAMKKDQQTSQFKIDEIRHTLRKLSS